MLLTTTRLRDHYDYGDDDVGIYIKNLTVLAEMTAEITDVPRIVRDPNDDMIIACALAVDADYIVTRDRDLLDLTRHKTIEIIAPEAFLAELRG